MQLSSSEQAFIDLALQYDVLQFGSFVLKSGRESPYFFNLGRINEGSALGSIGALYAQAVRDSGIEFDVLLGPAYKGIPLVVACAMQMYEKFGISKPVAYNRKEIKNHGEGGCLVGQVAGKRVMILDDVITAGTAIRQVVTLLRDQGAEVSGIVVALDRQERGVGQKPAVEALADELGVPVLSIINITKIIAYLFSQGSDKLANRLSEYFSQACAAEP